LWQTAESTQKEAGPASGRTLQIVDSRGSGSFRRTVLLPAEKKKDGIGSVFHEMPRTESRQERHRPQLQIDCCDAVCTRWYGSTAGDMAHAAVAAHLRGLSGHLAVRPGDVAMHIATFAPFHGHSLACILRWTRRRLREKVQRQRGHYYKEGNTNRALPSLLQLKDGTHPGIRLSGLPGVPLEDMDGARTCASVDKISISKVVFWHAEYMPIIVLMMSYLSTSNSDYKVMSRIPSCLTG